MSFMNNDCEWRNNLQAGDKVMIVQSCGWGNTSVKVLAVKRTTKTQIVLVNEERYTKSYGIRVDSNDNCYNKPRINPVNNDLINKIKTENKIRRLRNEIYEGTKNVAWALKDTLVEINMEKLMDHVENLNKNVSLLKEALNPPTTEEK